MHRDTEKKTLGELLQEHATLDSFIEHEPGKYAHNCNGIEKIYQRKARLEPKVNPYILYLAGGYGCGKTCLAANFLGLDPSQYWISCDLPWGDGYTGQKIAIFDDIRHGDLKFNKLLRLLDRYPVDVAIKGGEVPFKPSIIILTCPRLPREEWVFHDRWNLLNNGQITEYEDIGQLERRLDEIRQWDEIRECWSWVKGHGRWTEEAQYMRKVLENSSERREAEINAIFN